ncbi:MAG: hypothetical protein IAG13_21750 [Deltaproteobacteria bacterium]|nr:hypothetical protein [Nannocystaceae bacterium]
MLLLLIGCSEPVANIGEITQTTSSDAPVESSSEGGSTGVGEVGDDTNAADAESSGSSATTEGGSSTVLLDVGSAETGGPPTDDCPDETKRVIVLFADEFLAFQSAPELHSFDPETGTFSLIGPLDCTFNEEFGVYDMVEGLLVSRQGDAMTRKIGGKQTTLFAFNLGDLDNCSLISFDAGQKGGYPTAFAYTLTDPDMPEQMFIGNDVAQNLNGDPLPGSLWQGNLVDETLTAALVGHTPWTQTYVVGTGDGRLFAAGSNNDQSPPTDFAELDPGTGVVLETLLTWPEFMYPAFYGGDLLMFDRMGDEQQSVWRVDLDDDNADGENEVVSIAGDAAFPVGLFPVGVSSPTCIPTTPPG